MPNLAPVSTLRRVTVLIALLFASVAWACAPTAAFAQSLVDAPQTKEQAKAAAKAAEPEGDDDSGDDSAIMWGLVGVGAMLLIGVGWWMMRDAGDTVREERRPAPGRPLSDRTVGRGAPKAMFTADGDTAGKVGKRKRRQQGKRQRQARKANRTR
ncbi:MAG: hypothetical protein QM679_02190 [Patulibacter sp.]